MENPVKLFSSKELLEVELLQSKLNDQNIESYIVNKQDSAYVGLFGEAELFVNDYDVEKGKAVLDTIDQ